MTQKETESTAQEKKPIKVIWQKKSVKLFRQEKKEEKKSNFQRYYPKRGRPPKKK